MLRQVLFFPWAQTRLWSWLILAVLAQSAMGQTVRTPLDGCFWQLLLAPFRSLFWPHLSH